MFFPKVQFYRVIEAKATGSLVENPDPRPALIRPTRNL
jgi:hypothetical protein